MTHSARGTFTTGARSLCEVRPKTCAPEYFGCVRIVWQGSPTSNCRCIRFLCGSVRKRWNTRYVFRGLAFEKCCVLSALRALDQEPRLRGQLLCFSFRPFLRPAFVPPVPKLASAEAHNREARVTELRRDGLAAFTVDQRSRHTDVNPDECAACRAEIKHSMNPLPVFDHRKR
jgi:hypothetical protein